MHFLKGNDTKNTCIVTDCRNKSRVFEKIIKVFDLLPQEMRTEYSIYKTIGNINKTFFF